jgi:hypothetical protein
LLVIAALRMAAYPLHLWLAPSGFARDRGAQLLINGLGLVTGAWLLGRVYVMGAGAWFANPIWLPVLVFLTLLAGLAAWASRERDRLALLSSSRATWLWLIAALAPTAAGRDALGWGMAGVVLGLILLAAGQSITEQWRWRTPLALAAVTLAGLPLTAGMPARAFAEGPHLVLLLLIVVADALALAAILEGWTSARPPTADAPAPQSLRQLLAGSVNWDIVRLLIVLGLALVPDVLWGIQPARLAAQAGFGMVLSLGELLRMLGLAQLLAIVAALALGVGFYQLTQQPDALLRQWQKRLGAAAGLGWLLAGVSWLLGWVELAWRNALLIVEGEGYLGWVILALLLAVLAVRL